MEPDEDFIQGWEGDHRVDGVKIVAIGRSFVAVHPTRPSIVSCPCCGKAFATKRGVKLVANAIYVLQPN